MDQPACAQAGEPLEEALANAVALRQAGLGRLAISDADIRRWMSDQPGGYCDYGRHEGERAFDAGLRTLGHRVARVAALSKGASLAGALPLERLFKTHAHALHPMDVPTHLIADLSHTVSAALPPADARAGAGDDLDRRARTLRFQSLLDSVDMALTDDGRAALREHEGRAREASARLRPYLGRARRAEAAERLGLPFSAWPSGSALSHAGERPARMAEGLSSLVAGLEKEAESSRRCSAGVSGGRWKTRLGT